MISFEHQRLAQRMNLGRGNIASALGAAVDIYGSPSVLLIASDRAAEAARGILSPVAHISHLSRHVPIEHVHAARALAREKRADVVVSIGGGSATGLAKTLALDPGIPIIAVPTTFAGSEATPVWGITTDQKKETGKDARVLPASIIYDVDLFSAIPFELATASALNALAHGIDALWAPESDPLSTADAESGMRRLAGALRDMPNGLTPALIGELIVGTYLTSTAFAAAGSGMHHKLCHVLGGRFDLPHAQLHAVLLPYVVAFNIADDGDAAEVMARALGTHEPLTALLDIYRGAEAPRSLASLGVSESDLDEAAALCLDAIPTTNPRPAALHDVRALLQDAWDGAAPDTRRTES
jgi:maleylacetate reductase